MKRLALCIFLFVVGLAGGSIIRFSQHWQDGFRRGYITAVSQFQREAVREGHGHWERTKGSNTFRWNMVRTGYTPDSPSRIPGLE
jgi:hypothetical protein